MVVAASSVMRGLQRRISRIETGRTGSGGRGCAAGVDIGGLHEGRRPSEYAGAALTGATLCVAVQAQDVIVVANQDVSVSEVTDTELRDLFTGSRTQFHDGSGAVPALLKGGPALRYFCTTTSVGPQKASERIGARQGLRGKGQLRESLRRKRHCCSTSQQRPGRWDT